MSRTYRKFVKCGVCNGSNTEFYRSMNRKCRAKNRHSLRNMIANYDIETVSDNIPLGEVPIHDSWEEPTDGTFLVSLKDRDKFISNSKHNGSALNWWNRKIASKLKKRK